MILATLIVGAIILLLLWKEVSYPLGGLAEDSHASPSPQRRMWLCLTTSSNEITHDKPSSLAATPVLRSFMVTS